MDRRVRNLIVGLVAILVSLTGLLAVSALVPDVGCSSGSGPRDTGKTHIRIHGPDQVATGQSFTVNGTLEKGLFPEPFGHQSVTIDVASKLFHKKVTTDDQGNFSCDVVVDRPGTYTISASYYGDQLEHFQSSTDGKIIQVTGDIPAAKIPDSSIPPYYFAVIIIMALVAGYLLYRRFFIHSQPGQKPRGFPVWLSIVLALLTVGALLFVFFPGTPAATDTSGISQTLPGNTPSDSGIPTRIVFHPPSKAKTGVPIHIQGVLWQWGYQGGETIFPLPGQKVDILINGVPKIEGLVTDKAGRFATEIAIPHGGQYKITVVFHGISDRYLGSTITDKMIVGSTLFLYWNSPGWLIIYGLLIVLAILIDIYLSRRQKEGFSISIVCKGFTFALVVLEFAAILYTFYHPWGIGTISEGERWSRLFTDINLVVPEKVQPGQEFSLSGTLKVDQAPLAQQEVGIWLIKKNDPSAIGQNVATLTTDDTGSFADNIKVNSSGQYEISAVFDDTGDTYIESRDPHTLMVGDTTAVLIDHRNSPGWLRLIIILPSAILVFIVGFLFLRHHRKKSKGLKSEASKKVIVPSPLPMPTPAPTPIHTAAPPVNIDLPQISTPLPDVWGKDDSLLIVFTVDGTKQMLAQYSLDIEYGPDSTTRTPIGPDGRASQLHTFRKTGQYQIQAVLVKDVRNGYLPASRMVRIVDYREEIVRLYNEMVVAMRTRGVKLAPKMTAREVENRLWKAFPELSSDVTDSLVSVFEEANYSLHPISRLSYEKMYLAVLEVEKHTSDSGVISG